MNFVEWGLFLLAWGCSCYAHAQNSVASTSNGLTSVKQWLKLNRGAVMFNLEVCMGLGLIWTEAPLLFGAITEKHLPPTYGTAIIMGAALQGMVDRAMFAFGIKRVEVPKVVPPSPTDGKE